MKEIPPPSEIKAAIKRYESETAQKFYDHNIERIIEILEDFIENPGKVPKSGTAWLYVFETGRIKLRQNRQHIFRKELDLILDNLKANGYNCKLITREEYICKKRVKIVTLDIDFNNAEQEKKSFWDRLFGR